MYNDISRRTFAKAIGLLSGRVAAPLLEDLKVLVEEERLQDTAAISTLLDRHLPKLGAQNGD